MTHRLMVDEQTQFWCVDCNTWIPSALENIEARRVQHADAHAAMRARDQEAS